jgi:hypothetical protein
MPFEGYQGDYNWSRYTPLDETAYYDKFKSAYKNIRFNVPPNTQLQLTSTDAANLPGLAYRLLGDTSLWRCLLAYNGLSDPLTDVAVGIVIRVPTKAAVIAYLSSQQNSQQASVTI